MQNWLHTAVLEELGFASMSLLQVRFLAGPKAICVTDCKQHYMFKTRCPHVCPYSRCLYTASSTSGWKFKHPGRVGDAPVVGSGLYCDGKVGAAVATGDGEEILRTCLSFLVVENMRAGDPPGLACKKGIARLEEIVHGSRAAAASHGDRNEEAEAKMHDRLTVAVMAMSPSGEVGAASTLGPRNVHRGRPAFPLAIWREGEAVQVVEETDLP